ncbi:MAG: aminotransferase class V-fold PLP-dependent enzyme [Ectothiorhodospiraceae bacterium]|nr:aminotransferase class V-fold PLP-dependent enzyme [Ectothiorhodospiraceae bacterium]
MNDAAHALDWAGFRARFPGLEGRAYLNTSSSGVIPVEAADAACDYYRRSSERADRALGQWMPQVEAARGTVAAIVGATPEEIAFVPNASAGLNHGAALLDLRGEVLVLAEEFPSVPLAVERRGTWLRHVGQIAGRDRPACERLAGAVGASTVAIAVSHVQYATGERVDLEALGALCRERRLALLVDATQSVATTPIDVARWRPDALTFSGYKWACAGYGIGALFVRRDRLRRHRLPAAGWRSAVDPYGLANRAVTLADEARALELGNPLVAGSLALGASLALFARVGVTEMAARIEGLGDRLRVGLEALGLTLRTPSAPARRAGITVVEVPAADAVAASLAARGVVVSVRSGGLRFGVHAYNHERDIDHALDALDAALRAPSAGG